MTVKGALRALHIIMLAFNLSSGAVILVIAVHSAGFPIPDGIIADHVMPIVIFIPTTCAKAFAFTSAVVSLIAVTATLENHIVQAVIHKSIYPLHCFAIVHFMRHQIAPLIIAIAIDDADTLFPVVPKVGWTSPAFQFILIVKLFHPYRFSLVI